MDADQPDVISAEPSRIAVKGPRLIGVALVLIVLAVAVVTALRYHGQAAALRQQLRSAARPQAALTRRPMVSSAVYSLSAGGPVTGEVTVFSVRFARGTEQIVLVGHLSGARPYTRYRLVGTDCTSSNGADQSWASGTSDAHGTVRLTGRGWTVIQGDFYALWLDPSSLRSGGGLHGYLASASRLSAIRDGYPPCAP